MLTKEELARFEGGHWELPDGVSDKERAQLDAFNKIVIDPNKYRISAECLLCGAPRYSIGAFFPPRVDGKQFGLGFALCEDCDSLPDKMDRVEARLRQLPEWKDKRLGSAIIQEVPRAVKLDTGAGKTRVCRPRTEDPEAPAPPESEKER